MASGGLYFWLGASAEPTGLGSADAPEPNKSSPPYGCHPSRKLYPHDLEWQEAVDSALESLRHNCLDGWEIELIRRRVNIVLSRLMKA